MYDIFCQLNLNYSRTFNKSLFQTIITYDLNKTRLLQIQNNFNFYLNFFN